MEENIKKKKEEDEKKKKELENQKKEEDAKKKKMLEEKKKKEDEAKKQKEKEQQKKKELDAKQKEDAKKLKEKELQRKKEEEAKKKEEIKKKKEEEAKKKKELEDNKKKEAELKKKKMIEDKKKKEEEDKKKKEEEEKKKKELEEKKKLKEAEKEKKKLEAQKKKEEEEKKKKEKEQKMKEKKEKEEQEKKQKEEELRKKMDEKRKEKKSPEKNVLRGAKPEKKQLERPTTEYPLNKKTTLEKIEGNNDEENAEGDESQKPKKKKKIVKKTITKMVKKKVHKDSLEYQNYLREKEKGFKAGGGFSGSGGGLSSDFISKHYNTANVSKPVQPRCECINCHSEMKGDSGKSLCEKCSNNLRAAKNDREFKSLKYYQDDNDDKFDTIGTKEFYQLNKDRYLNDLWKEENDKLQKIDENIDEMKNNDDNLKIDSKDNKLIFEMPICSKCGKIQNQNSNKGIYFCKNCEGLICGNCSKGHYKENPEHNCNHVNIEDKKYWKVPEKLNCSNCNQTNPITAIYICNLCEGKPFCKNCSQNHNINNPNHVLKLFGKLDEDSEKSPFKSPIKREKKDISTCQICGVKNIISNTNIIPCSTCKIILCDKCQNDHYIKNPTHLKPNENIMKSDKKNLLKKFSDLSDDKINKKKSIDIQKCPECGNLSGNENDTINKCNTCKINLCDNCLNKHKLNGHNILKYPNQKSDNNELRNKIIKFSTKCKECNSFLPLGDEECIVVNCINCEGNLCDECCENHEKNKPQHDLNPIRAIFIENTDFEDSIPKLKCGKCMKNISDNDNIYYCDECQIDLCNNCGNNHNKDNLEHDLILTKRILIDDNNKENVNCIQCGSELGNNDFAFKKCDKCKIDLCDACGDNHIKKYANHNILTTLLKNNYNKNKNDFNFKEIENALKSPNDKCNLCNKRINIKNNDIINFCKDCNGNLCDNCKINHQEQYPAHIKINPKAIIIDKYMDDYNKLPIYKCIACDKDLKLNLNNPYINCDKCHGNICDECNKTHLQEFPTHKLQFNKYIIIDDNADLKEIYESLPINFECISCYEKIKLNPETIYCNECKGNLCKKCEKLHGKNNKNHKPKILNSILIEKSKDNDFNPPNIICNSCNKNLEKDINDYLNNCPKCKIILCDNCISNHNKDFSNHNLGLNKYIFYELQEQDNDADNKNKPNSLKSIPNDKCSICNKGIRSGNNLISHCNKCKGSLCETCEQNHESLFPGHDFIIKKYLINPNINKFKNDNLIENDKCYKCHRNIPITNDGIIIYCFDCSGNLCNSCGSSHTQKNQDHKLYNFKTITIEKERDELINRINNKCEECGNKINLKTIYKCTKCDKNLCDKCSNNHIRNKPDHDLLFIKTIEETNYPIECNVCGRITKDKNGNIENNKCDKCLVNLCEPCSKTHLKKYPNHKINKLFINENTESNKINDNIPTSNILYIPNDKCNICKQKINLKENNIIHYCKECKGNICNNCNNNHNKEFSNHIVSRPNIKILKNKKEINKLPIYKCIACDKELKVDLNEPYINCDKCHGNICDECNKTHTKEFAGHNTLLTKYIITDKDNFKNYLYENIPINFDCISCKEKMPIFSEIYYCEDCNGNLCKNCSKFHNKNKQNHLPTLLNLILIEKENENLYNPPKIMCDLCKKNLNKKINDCLHKCQKCKIILCDDCSLKHNKETPDHNLVYDRYIFYEINDENNLDKNKDISIEKCSNCINNIRIENNKTIAHCNKCKGSLCESCEQNHNSLFPGHDLIIKKYKINLNPKINEKDSDIIIDKCLLCFNDIDDLKKGNTIYCLECPGNLCHKCENEHNKKYPEHNPRELNSIIIDNEVIKKNCNECGNKINANIFFKCNNCNTILCSKCGNSHIKFKNNHQITIIKNIFDGKKTNLNKTKKEICLNCNKVLYLKNDDVINYCSNCKKNLCENCHSNHKEEYTNHIIVKPRVYLLNKNKDNLKKLPIYKCIACDKKINGDLNTTFINCDKCHGNICDECNNNHTQEFPTHNLKLIKYIIDNENEIKDIKELYNDEKVQIDEEVKNIEKPRIKLRNKQIDLKMDIDLNKLNNTEKVNNENLKKINIPHDINCISCNSKIDNFKDCTPCYGYLCSACNVPNKIQNKFEIVHSEKDSSFSPLYTNCIICKEYLLNDINKPINHCTLCNGNLCSNCSINHLSQYPQHNLLLTRFILTQYISYDSKSLNNKNICLECNKNLIQNNSKLIHYCSQCKENICLDCVEKHNNEYPEHILILSKNIGNGNILPKENCICNLCKLNHKDANQKIFYFCKECNKYFCETCKNIHNEKNYSHIFIDPHNFEDHKNKKSIKIK